MSIITKMKTVILGAGFSGLTAAYELAKAGQEVIVLEKHNQVGGAAGGFKLPHWNWHLDYTYHHCFGHEHAILDLAKEINFPDFLLIRPETASLYYETNHPDKNTNLFFEYLFGQNHKSYKLDSPLDLLRFDRISFLDRFRTGLVLALLKFGPKLDYYDHALASEALSKTMGKKSYQQLWEPLFAKKFAQFQKQINLGFFWARLRRTADLTYPKGGYQALANHLAKAVQAKSGQILLNHEVKAVKPKTNGFIIRTNNQNFEADRLINTLPSPVFLKLDKGLLPQNYRKRLEKIQYLGAQNLIFSSRDKVLPKTYWLSLAAKATKKNPYPGLDWMVVVQQTNFVAAKNYNNKHLLYLATYTNKPKNLVIKDKKLAKKYVLIKQSFIPYGQPLYTPEFVKNKPDYTTPIKNLYFANMELTYPYDRGTNQAVRCGQTVVEKMS